MRDKSKDYIFPRIPLRFEMPENFPDVDIISNISVIPEIKKYYFHSEELELEGIYQITVSYYKDSGENERYRENNALKSDDFFSCLKIQSNGLLEEVPDTEDNEENRQELYTVHFSRLFHTAVELEAIGNPRYFKPGMVVENVTLSNDGGRTLIGELILALVNLYKNNTRK